MANSPTKIGGPKSPTSTFSSAADYSPTKDRLGSGRLKSNQDPLEASLGDSSAQDLQSLIEDRLPEEIYTSLYL